MVMTSLALSVMMHHGAGDVLNTCIFLFRWLEHHVYHTMFLEPDQLYFLQMESEMITL